MYAEDFETFKELHEKKEGSVMMLCEGGGRIVFVYGDSSVLELKPSKLIQRNIFSLGFSQLSLLTLSRMFPHGILNISSKPMVTMNLEIISRNEMSIGNHPIEWAEEKDTLMKSLTMSCSLIRVGFLDEPLREKLLEIQKNHRILGRENAEQEELVLVEFVQERREIQTKLLDYEYIRHQVIQELMIEELS